MLSGGLDQLIKVYDLQEFAVTHTMSCDSPVLSIAMTVRCVALAAVVCRFLSVRQPTHSMSLLCGSVGWCAQPDGRNLLTSHVSCALVMKRRSVGLAEAKHSERKKQKFRAGTYRYFMRGQLDTAEEAKDRADPTDVIVEARRRKRLAPFDRYLRQFQYHRALDAALTTDSLPVVCSVVDELRQRSGLDIALQGRDEDTLEPLLRFLTKHVCDYRWGRILVPLADQVLRMYASVVGQSPSIDALLFSMRSRIREELHLHRLLYGVIGQLEKLIAGSARVGL